MQIDNNSILNIHVLKNTNFRKMNLKNNRCKTCLISEFKTVFCHIAKITE